MTQPVSSLLILPILCVLQARITSHATYPSHHLLWEDELLSVELAYSLSLQGPIEPMSDEADLHLRGGVSGDVSVEQNNGRDPQI